MNLPTVQPIPWKTLGLGILAVLALSFLWNRDHRALADARRGQEAARLSALGQLAAEQETARDLRGSLSELVSKNDLLQQALEETKRAAPDAKPVAVASLRTAPALVQAVPRPGGDDPALHPPAPPPCAAPLKSNGAGAFYCPEAKPAACVLANGDATSFAVDEIAFKTSGGNKLVTGTAEFWRESPGPRSKLAASKFSSALSSTGTLAVDPPPRWGAELAGLCTRDGCGLGGGVLLPPVSFLGLRWEARADLYAGPALAAGAALGVRW